MTGVTDSESGQQPVQNVQEKLKNAQNGSADSPKEINSEVPLTNGTLANGHAEGDTVIEKTTEKMDAKEGLADKPEGGDSSSVQNSTAEASPEGTTQAAPGGAEEEAGKDADPEVVIIQDTGFTIEIQCQGIDSFDLPVSSMELVQEIYQVLIDKEETCHRTCFTLQVDGITLDNFCELKSIEGLKEGSIVKVVEEPYTVREARIHVRHVRDLLKSIDSQDAYNGSDCNSLSFLNVVTAGNILDKKSSSVENTVDCTPPDYIMPGSDARPLTPLHPTSKEQKSPQCLKVITYSGWNPPPGNRRMHGDLLYLYVVTLEDKRYHITASTRGFFVNNSTSEEFNPRPAAQRHLCHSLVDLLSQISPAFKRNFQSLLKKRAQKHPFERVATPYQIYSWMSPNMEHTVDSIRADDAFSSRLGYEEHIPGQTRDWNEELQTTRELPRKNLPERLIRERAIFKVHSDFVVAATRGAIAVVDGNIMAINPGEDTKMQMFLWNNIFFSLGFDVKDHYKDFGGDAAAYVAPANDLQGVKAYATVDTENLYTLGTVVVDYRGYRITAQSIIPGILEREQEQSVVYGSIDFGKTVVTHEKYQELLKKTAAQLKIRAHKVINQEDQEIELLSSVECKGIIGNDGRYYVLDLLRTFPSDVNFLPHEDITLSQEVQKLGYPRAHRHKLACLRQELIDAFVDTRYIAFVKHAAFQFQQLRVKRFQEEQAKLEKEKKEKEEQEKKDGEKEGGEKEVEKVKTEVTKEEDLETEVAKKMIEELTKTDSDNKEGEDTKAIVKRAANAVGSLSDTEFIISFNSDVFQPHVKHAQPDSDALKREQSLVKEAAEFMLLHQIPTFMRDCLEHTSSPIDGYTLSEALHHNGINIRYLGKVAEMISKHEPLSYLFTICVAELITRSAKHIYKTYSQSVELMSLSAAISHFLNCLLGAYPTPHTQVATDELQSQRSKKRNKKKNKGVPSLALDNTEWALETPKTLWKKLVEEAQDYYSFKLECDGIDSMVEKYNIQKVSLMRSVCKTVGIQVLLKEYALENKLKQPFLEEDIQNVFPIVKHIHPKATDAYHVFTSGQGKIQQGLLREGYELINEALNLLNNVYGAMHPEIAACARLLARLNYIMGDYGEALVYQQRAVLMSERVLGIDHPNTITEYAHMALYSFANNQIPIALKLMYRARYLALLCHGEEHPEIALFDSNIGLILHAVGEFDLSMRFLQKALELNIKFFGEGTLKVAMSYHLVARTYSCKGDFRTALSNEKEAYTIYKTMLGEDHERTRESSECLKHLTTQAVKFQKTMAQLSKGEKVSAIPPLQIQTPSLSNVLDTLNLINGIVFVHISQEDIERFREEIVRRQQQGQGQGQGQDGESKAVEESKQTATETGEGDVQVSSAKEPVPQETNPVAEGTTPNSSPSGEDSHSVNSDNVSR